MRASPPLLALLAPFAAADEVVPGFPLRLASPTIHGKAIVFGYAGDLYTVASSGGIAREV